MKAQEVVERALELLGPDRGTVLVEHSTSANLRWANSTLTTNGLAAQQLVHVVAHPVVQGGLAAGTASADVRTPADLQALVEAARAAARGSGPADDAAAEVPARPASADWDEPPLLTTPEELAPVGALLGQVLPGGDMDHFGYAEHSSIEHLPRDHRWAAPAPRPACCPLRAVREERWTNAFSLGGAHRSALRRDGPGQRT